MDGFGCPYCPSCETLLSFLLGILSDLLYVFVCFALFLDRAVTFVWDAPLRRRTGGVIHALARSRAASAALIFIPCFLLPFSLLTQKGVLILAGDKPLGFVQDADMLSGTVQELEASASAASGRNLFPSLLAEHPLDAYTAL